MPNTHREWFKSPKGDKKAQKPFFYLITSKETTIRDFTVHEVDKKDYVVRLRRGGRCQTRGSLFKEWASQLQFPDYFGNNWNAFDECINDLSWLRGKKYIIVITNFEKVLVQDAADLPIFLTILKEAVAAWMNPQKNNIQGKWTNEPIPFHIIFQCEPQNHQGCKKILENAGIEVKLKTIATHID